MAQPHLQEDLRIGETNVPITGKIQFITSIQPVRNYARIFFIIILVLSLYFNFVNFICFLISSSN